MGKKSGNDELILFEKIKQGDIELFEILFEKYYQPLCNFAFLFLKNEPLSQEVVSDIFVNIWMKKENIEIHTSLKSFLYQSTRNAVISSLRKKNPQFVRDFQDDISTDIQTPETILLDREFENAMQDLIGELPKMSGLVLRMKKIDGLRYKEIAEVLNISEKTVENHITQAIKKMRKFIDLKPCLKKYFGL